MANDLKPHIGIFGRMNYGKSSIINKLTGQPMAIVSEQAGTTTDPVKKSIEIFGIGPVVLIDTAGIDDISELGKQRVEKTYQTLKEIDCAILVIADNQFGEPEATIIEQFKDKWDWTELSGNCSLKLTYELLDKYIDRWDWSAIIQWRRWDKDNNVFSFDFLKRYQDRIPIDELEESALWSEIIDEEAEAIKKEMLLKS